VSARRAVVAPLLVGFVVAGLAACGSAPAPKVVTQCKGAPRNPDADTPALVGESYGREMAGIPLNAVVFDDKDSSRRVAVQDLSATRTDTESVRVEARFLNCTPYPATLAVRTRFMDAKQRSTEKPTAWKTVTLPPGALGDYDAVSLGTNEVKLYVVEVRNGAL
jgi:hypothetical protein